MRSALIRGASALILAGLAGAIAEAVLLLPPPGRWLLLVALVILPVATFFTRFIPAQRNPYLRPGRPSDRFWALRLGERSGIEYRDRLLNSLEVNQPRSVGRDTQSDDLADHALHLAVARIPPLSDREVVEAGPYRRSLRTAAFSLLTGVLAFALLPGTLLPAASRLFQPAREFTKPPAFALEVEPLDAVAYRGEPVRFDVRAIGVSPREVAFRYHLPGGAVQNLAVHLDPDTIRSDPESSVHHGQVTLDGFASSVNYWVEAGEVATPSQRLEVIQRPQIVNLMAKVSPPAYSRLPSSTGRENNGDIEALSGSNLRLEIAANKSLASAWMILQRTDREAGSLDSLPLKVKGSTALLELPVRSGGTYQIRLRDSDGHYDKDPVAYHIRLLADEPPAARIAFPDADIVLGDDMVLPLRIEADDDFGISRIALEYHHVGDSTIIGREIPFRTVEDRSAVAEYNWELGALGLVPGDVIEYRAMAADNDNISGPKRAWSESRLVRLPTLEEIIAGVDQSEHQAFEESQRTIEAARELRDEMNRIAEELKRNPETDWQRRKEMEEALGRQQELNQRLDEVRKTLDKMVEQLEKHDLLTAETLEKYQQLQELLREVATPELKAAMERLQASLASQDPDQIRQALEQFDMDREQFLRNLERSMNILKQLQLERKLDELARRAGELRHAQEEALDRMDRSETSDLAVAQEMMAQAMSSLIEEIKQSGQLADESGETKTAQDLGELASRTETNEMPEQMRQTGRDAAAGDLKKAGEKGRTSARQLTEMETDLGRIARELKERRKQDLARKLRRLVEELLMVSEGQEELMEESRRLGHQSPRHRELTGRQSDLRSALARVTGRTFDLSRETFFITPELGAALGRSLEELDRTLEAYTDRNPHQATAPQKKAVGEINRSANELLAILSQLQGSESSSGFEEMMERLSQMASQQQGLNEQSMPMPGPGGSSSMPSPGDMARMAAQQRALQQAMQEAAGEAKGMSDILGDLEGIAGSMGEVAEDLEQARLDERTQRLQRQIVNRLLDATRSAREQEYSKKRESKVATRMARRPPAPLTLDTDRDRLRRDLMRALQEGYTHDYRRLIREYFNRIESVDTAK